jgi:N-acetylmuramoyl-L-alanine amidase
MTYTLRENRTSKNYTPAAQVPAAFGQARVVKQITWHHWGNLGQRFDDVENFLCTNNTPTSAHYIMQDGLVSCIVTPDDAAWHSGNAVGNATTVGVEARPEATDGDYRTGAELVNFIRSIYGDIPIVGHNHWYATACPGKWDLQRLDRLARSLKATPVVKPASSTPVKTTAPAKPVAAKPAAVKPTGLTWKVEKGDTLAKVAKHYGIGAATIASYNRLPANGSLKVGQVLHIPGPLVWIVDPGNTLAEIAAHYGLTTAVVAANNGIKDPNQIRVGQAIKIL